MHRYYVLNIIDFIFHKQARMENAKQEQGNSITQMFDRLKVSFLTINGIAKKSEGFFKLAFL